MGKGGSTLGSQDLIEQWRITQQEYLTDTPTVMAHQALDQRRLHVQQEMMQLLGAFLNRTITLKEFNATFQQKTQGAWNVFRRRYARWPTAHAGTHSLFRATHYSAKRSEGSIATGTHSLSFKLVVALARCAPLAHLFSSGALHAHERRRAITTATESYRGVFRVPDPLSLVGTSARRLLVGTGTHRNMARPTKTW